MKILMPPDSKKIWVNGCFDVLHVGHIKLLEYAKGLGGYLVVGVDSDQKVSESKGKNRPFNTLEDRKSVLQSIRYVDKVVTYNSEQELEDHIKNIEPDVLVIGSDWKGKRVVGSSFAKELRFFERIGNYSTTNILNGEKE